MLYFETLSDERGLFDAWTLQRRLARQLFELAQGSGALRFPCPLQQLYLVLLNWDTVRRVCRYVGFFSHLRSSGAGGGRAHTARSCAQSALLDQCHTTR